METEKLEMLQKALNKCKKSVQIALALEPNDAAPYVISRMMFEALDQAHIDARTILAGDGDYIVAVDYYPLVITMTIKDTIVLVAR